MKRNKKRIKCTGRACFRRATWRQSPATRCRGPRPRPPSGPGPPGSCPWSRGRWSASRGSVEASRRLFDFGNARRWSIDVGLVGEILLNHSSCRAIFNPFHPTGPSLAPKLIISISSLGTFFIQNMLFWFFFM